ncbi:MULTISPECIES: hypothetical protein [Pandoraea]|uniref:Uncharacterized protein n=1 Tax=Pandoraea anhela TaxID=2508295 RepID=A0A5E4VQ93_9BURK|nr:MULTISPECIES: hypothetical protein [Pandoraea]VVE13220.1 hypothetical protein PAN31108_02736 [Pandoraea anhela]
MTPSQVRERIRELEAKFSRIKEEFYQVVHSQEDAPRDNDEATASGEAGEIGEDLTGDR